MEATYVTVELFNHCAGSCTGCLLSANERKAVFPVLTPPQFGRVLDALAEHGRGNGLTYRPVMVFGDVPWMPLDVLRRYFDEAAARRSPFGLTMTLVEADKADAYRAALAAAVAADPGAVFDITVDPIRLERDDGYRERLGEAMGTAPHLHLAALLSEAVMERWAPEALADDMSARLGGRPLSLGFTPTLSNLGRANYGYDVASAAAYAARFYGRTAEGRAHLGAELERFSASGGYRAFLSQTFHVGPGLTVHPVAYSVFGDVILDHRNLGAPLGSLAERPLSDLLGGPVAARLSVMADAWMDRGSFGCRGCRWFDACATNGVGLVRKVYSDHEFRSGSCYGPAGLSDGVAESLSTS